VVDSTTGTSSVSTTGKRKFPTQKDTVMAYDNTNRGALFRNRQHEQDTDPSYTGTINVGGTDYWLSAWLKTSKAGEKFMSLSVKPKQAAKARPIPGRSDEDSIPF
jgi:hypothetical protein